LNKDGTSKQEDETLTATNRLKYEKEQLHHGKNGNETPDIF